MRKRIFAAMLLTCLLAGCGTAGHSDVGNTSAKQNPDNPEAQPCELNVFAAASMQETLEQIVADYRSIAPDVTIVLNLDSSGTLKTQIEQGAPCDLFISAAQKQMDQLDSAAGEEKNPDALDFVDSESRVNLLENRVVLVVSEGNSKGITALGDIADKIDLIALGNSDVPVGQYSEEILTYFGVLDELNANGKITYGSNVKEVTTQVTEGIADCGIVYATDAFSAGLTIVDEATADMCRQVIYPAAVLKASENKEQAQKFLNYLKTAEAAEVFESVGFRVLE